MLSSCHEMVFDAVPHTMQPLSSLEHIMARYSIKGVSLSPPHFKWATIWKRFRASLHCVSSTQMCFLKERRESNHISRNFIDSSTGRNVLPILIATGLWTLDRGAVKCMTRFLGCKLEAIPSRPFFYCIYCLLWMSRWCPKNILPGHSQTMLWRCPWQYMRAAHWSSVQCMSEQGHHQLEHLPLGRIRVWS